MIVQGGSGAAGDFLYVLGILARAGWRYRSELAPVYWWLGCLIAGAWLHATHPGWWPVPLAAGLAGLIVIGWLPRPVVARWPILGRWRVRLWSIAFTTAVTGYVLLATLHGATAGELPTYAALVTAGLGVPWWWREDRRRLSRVRLIRERFPDTAEAAGLTGARMVSAVVGRWGWTARLKLRRGQHFADAVVALSALESALGSRVGALRVEAVNADAAEVVLRMVETDPHAEPIPWTPRPGKRPASITDPVKVGVWEDGSDVTVSLLRKHVLIGGATDSGKSGLLNVILGRLAECSDAIIWGIDLKEGMELAPWSKVLNRLAVNGLQAAGLLREAVAELERRAGFLAEQGIREWTPTPDAPALVVMIDEYAELSPAARKLADSIARRGRAVAVTLLVATQRPTQKTMGDGSAIRSQMNIRFCLRVVERADVDLILGAGSLTTGWDTTGFDAPGKFLLRAPGHETPRRARAEWISNADVKTTATRNARPDHHNPSRPQDATGDQPGSGSGKGTAGAQNGPDAPHKAPGTTGAGPGVSGPDVALWEALKQAPPTGASVADLMGATGQSKTALYRRLQALRAQGRAAQISRGRWKATPRPDRPTNPEG